MWKIKTKIRMTDENGGVFLFIIEFCVCFTSDNTAVCVVQFQLLINFTQIALLHNKRFLCLDNITQISI